MTNFNPCPSMTKKLSTKTTRKPPKFWYYQVSMSIQPGTAINQFFLVSVIYMSHNQQRKYVASE